MGEDSVLSFFQNFIKGFEFGHKNFSFQLDQLVLEDFQGYYLKTGASTRCACWPSLGNLSSASIVPKHDCIEVTRDVVGSGTSSNLGLDVDFSPGVVFWSFFVSSLLAPLCLLVFFRRFPSKELLLLLLFTLLSLDSSDEDELRIRVHKNFSS